MQYIPEDEGKKETLTEIHGSLENEIDDPTGGKKIASLLETAQKRFDGLTASIAPISQVDPWVNRKYTKTKVNKLRLENEIYGLIAVGGNGAFGLNNGLPWKNSTDMAWFKSVTMHRNIVTSKKTKDSMPNLPGRIMNIATRAAVCAISGWPLNPETCGTDIFIIGGKRVIQNTIDNMDGFYVTVIPGEFEHDVNFDINDIYKAGFKLDFIGGSKAEKDYCYLLAFSRGEVLNRHTHHVLDHFEPYLKLTLKKDIIIAPGAHGTAQINETVYTPRNQIGIFDVRKKLGDKGLYTTGITFKREWCGVPTITITNKGTETIYLYKGEEIGEISFTNNTPVNL